MFQTSRTRPNILGPGTLLINVHHSFSLLKTAMKSLCFRVALVCRDNDFTRLAVHYRRVGLPTQRLRTALPPGRTL